MKGKTLMFDLTGMTAIVTGASSGIGREVAKAFAKQGANLALFARRLDRLQELQKEIENNGGKAIAIACDVSNEEQVKKGVEEVKAKFGRIDILFNNAGIAVGGSVEDIAIEDWDRIMNINVKGAYLTSKYCVPFMKEQKFGRIINTASVNAIIGGKFDPRHSYNASKAGVVGLTIGMATSLAQYGITVNSIAPGLFLSEMTENTLFKMEGYLEKYNLLNPTGRPGNTDEINGLAVFLASRESSYITAQNICVDGGLTSV